MSSNENTDSQLPRDDILAKRMFYVGLAFLPWLWVANILYFSDRVYGNLCPSFCKRAGFDENRTTPNTGGILNEVLDDDDDASNPDNNDNLDITPEYIEQEVRKWVKRSTMSATITLSLLIAWIITFQVNKDGFAPGWFVMKEDEGERTGW
mmetsp:Transcript_10916/g.15371  ORF Transcript_10916/g.15371 Transcript_10916/m.15371 type:complete len:151 (+) Transcript_10916:204-656(+)|eukprot:CAMPEP_0184861196 /NCGR_PEP_ID=MMETSP0580-20130426/5954_1 /TAXON_ID=1118495 /ORGANISM="Dactyliosolen fragilissimus" /LENGTH=150 /DNA_ID=CAMNT_0027358617 /DNA_START=143 /DNA_END=592 /DNA_ORIENTATION=+